MSVPMLNPTPDVPTPYLGTPPGVGLFRVGAGIFVGSLAVLAPALGLAISLMPARVATLQPDDKVMWLAVLTTIAAVIAFVSILIAGAWSDRTRSRFGNRTPWVLAGGLVCAGGTALLALADSMPLFLVGYIISGIGTGMAMAGVGPILPERVPVEKRGIVSSAAGAAPLAGGTVGVVAAGIFAENLALAFLVLAAFTAILSVLFALLLPGISNTHIARPPRPNPFAAIKFPRHAADFYWAFAGRLGVILGYYIVSSYQLYVLTDYLSIGHVDAVQTLGVAAVVNLVGSLAGVAIAGPLSDVLGRRKTITTVSSVVIGVGVLMPLLVPSVLGFLIYTGIAGLGLGMFFAVDGALLSQLLPSEADYGRDLGVANLATNGGQLFGPVIGSVVIGAGMGFQPLFVVALILCVAAGALLIPIKSVK